MDKLLNRGAHRIAGEMKIINATPAKGFKVLGMGKEFTRGDKLIYIVTYSWIFLWTAIFIAGTIYNFTHEVKDALWMKYWKYYVTTYTAISVIVIIWFTIGGIKNLKEMFGSLRIMTRDDGDVGFVVKNNEE